MTDTQFDTSVQQNCCVVICSVPDTATAANLANTLVAEKLAACVNILPAVTSVYVWQDALQSDEESLLFIKTLSSAFAGVRDRIRALHPYELPEIIMVPITGGSTDYLDWVARSVGITSK